MVLTVEPGCYFIQRLIEQAKSSPDLNHFLVKEEIDRYAHFGGVCLIKYRACTSAKLQNAASFQVRIEENVVVTDDGCEVLSDVPRTVEEIEDWMSRDYTEYDNLDQDTMQLPIK